MLQVQRTVTERRQLFGDDMRLQCVPMIDGPIVRFGPTVDVDKLGCKLGRTTPQEVQRGGLESRCAPAD